MAKLTLTDLASLQNETSVITTINNNNDAIEQAMEKTLTRDGTSPNSLSAQLDMNTNKIINLAKGTTTGEALEYSQLQEKVDDINTIYNQAVTAKNQAQAAQSGAELAESNAEAAEAQAEDILLEIQTIFDTYNNQFLGTFTSDPTVDNDGNPLTVGDIYYNSTFLSMRVWDGSVWQDIAAMTPTSHNEISNKVYINPVFRGTFLPETSDGVALGSSSYMFSDLFLAAGAVINFNASDVTITHSTNSLAFAGATTYNFDNRITRDTNFYFDIATDPYIYWDTNDSLSYSRANNAFFFTINGSNEMVLSATNLTPGSNDGNALGSTSFNWADLFLASGAVINFANSNVTITHGTGSLSIAGVSTAGVGLDGPLKVLGGYGVVNGSGNLAIGSAGASTDNVSLAWGDNSGKKLNLGYGSTGTFVPRYTLTDTGIFSPATDDGAVLGTTALSWSDLFLASGAVLNFNNGNYTVTHSSGLLNFSGSGQFGNTLFLSGGYAGAYSGGAAALKFGGGGGSPNGAAIGWGDGSGWTLNLGYNSSSTFTPRYQFVDNGIFRPANNDGAVLGTTSNSWSDLFLASGAVVNFNNGNYTLTHSSGVLTASGDLQVSTPGSASGSVLTLAGAQTLIGGFSATSVVAGTFTTGTFTPDAQFGNFQHYTNGGAHTLGVPATVCTIVIECTNNASAGILTTSSYTKVTGDALNTTNGNKFLLFITKSQNYSHLHIQALQ